MISIPSLIPCSWGKQTLTPPSPRTRMPSYRLTHVMDMETLERQHQARRWLAAYAQLHQERNNRIRAAYSAGLSAAEIARLLGLSRSQITLILSRPER